MIYFCSCLYKLVHGQDQWRTGGGGEFRLPTYDHLLLLKILVLETFCLKFHGIDSLIQMLFLGFVIQVSIYIQNYTF
jgi:hypothetical protein